MTPGRIPRDPRDGDVVTGYRVCRQGTRIEEIRYTYHLELPRRRTQTIICAWLEESRTVLRNSIPAYPDAPDEWHERESVTSTSNLHAEQDLKTWPEALTQLRAIIKLERLRMTVRLADMIALEVMIDGATEPPRGREAAP